MLRKKRVTKRRNRIKGKLSVGITRKRRIKMKNALNAAGLEYQELAEKIGCPRVRSNITNALGRQKDEPRDPAPDEQQESEWIEDIYRVLGIPEDWIRNWESDDPLLTYVVQNWSTLDDRTRQTVQSFMADQIDLMRLRSR